MIYCDWQLAPLVMSVSMSLTQRLSKYAGRLLAATGIKMLGIVCFALMIILYEIGGSHW